MIPILPLTAAGLSAVARKRHRRFAATVAIASMALALALSCVAFATVLEQVGAGEASRQAFNFRWFQFGETWVDLGWVLDPLTAIMLVMVSFIGMLVFIYSTGYMAHDENFTRFFCFLSLFAASMLGLIIANSLLLFFICWELVGLTSYLLIGFWYHKPSASAAAKKAFITTRIGDLAFLLGIVWLYSQAQTLLFYDQGNGCLEPSSLSGLMTQYTGVGITAATGIALLIFCGAIGKSGQVPLHVWLPDAMEGPTPVSALIHAATMVAAGVFLLARVYPLMAASAALPAVAWLGAITALFAASIALAQTDIKRILAYSTVSQLGFMMLGLGAGGVAVGLFHLIAHAFFKALLFLGAGSVIHGCHDQHDIRRLGGLRRFMPVTFATYVVGMLALSGFPLLLSGFWSKDEILHAAHAWKVSQWPFYLGVVSALLTAFYMTRQVCYVFFGDCRLGPGRTAASERQTAGHASVAAEGLSQTELAHEPQESPRLMLVPLILLAAASILLGFLGTPAWPWLQAFVDGEPATLAFGRLAGNGVPEVMAISTAVVFAGLGLGWWFYGRKPARDPRQIDPLERARPDIFYLLRREYFIDEIYEWSVVRLNAGFARTCKWIDEWVWNGMAELVALAAIGLSWVSRLFDEHVVNRGFDETCEGLRAGGRGLSHVENGQVQHYLRILGLGLMILVVLLVWGCYGR
jgi:NADH-quinone oxidoreductase subunit L